MAERTKDVLRGNLDLMVLSALSKGPMYGYLIQQRLNDASGGQIAIQAGTLYPILHKLETHKLVKSRWDGSSGRSRKWYELTAKGSRRLEQRASQWHEVHRVLERLLRPGFDVSADPA